MEAAVAASLLSGTGAGIAGTGLASSAGFLSTLSTIATVASAGMSIVGGIQGMQAGRAEAAQLNQQAQFERVRAKQEEANRQARLTQILGEQAAMAAGRGVQLGSGSNLAIADFSVEEAARESRIAGMDTQFRQSQLRGQASQARKSGTASLISGIGSAASTAVGGFERSLERTRIAEQTRTT
jgi:hypothetical protein